jgi:HJR/Mrr/RecB family endonuclease
MNCYDKWNEVKKKTSKRMLNKIGVIDKKEFEKLKRKYLELLQ